MEAVLNSQTLMEEDTSPILVIHLDNRSLMYTKEVIPSERLAQLNGLKANCTAIPDIEADNSTSQQVNMPAYKQFQQVKSRMDHLMLMFNQANQVSSNHMSPEDHLAGMISSSAFVTTSKSNIY